MRTKKTIALTEEKKISGEFPKEIKGEDTQHTKEMAEDDLGLVVGGTRETAIEFLEKYAQGIPIGRQRKEAEDILRELKGEED